MINELERIIENGQKTFIEVGVALLTIRDRQLYSQPTFKDYLAERWPQLSVSHVYHLMDATRVATNLVANGVIPPIASTQAVKLAILEPEEQVTVWKSIVDQKPTAQQVKVAAYYQYLSTHNPQLLELVKNGRLGAEPAYNLCRRIMKLHEDLVTAIQRYGFGEKIITVEAIDAILMLARRNQDEYDDLLQSGFLQDGNREVPFAQITMRDIERYLSRLHWEQEQPTMFVVSTNPQEIVQQGGTIWAVVATFDTVPKNAKLLPQHIVDAIKRITLDK
ncbi:MAG: hypothetical protein E6Q36_05715 [Chryseobacterium sp.]|nr:MAG: hypothetical protein E6Q36_05715 [Chryseobacterium sp.]